MQQLDQSRVAPEEIDSLGHLNVRFYLARVDRANRALFQKLGLDDAMLAGRNALLRRMDTYSRFRREQFEGAELTVHGGRLGVDDTHVRAYFEIRNPARDELAANFVTVSVLADRASRQVLALPPAVLQPNAGCDVELPDYAVPRSLSLGEQRTDVSLRALAERIGESSEFGMTGTREGTVEAEDCGADGVLRDDVDLMFLLHRRQFELAAKGGADAKAFGPPIVRTDDGHRFAWAMLETRITEIARPHAGDTVVWVGADVDIAEKSRRTRRWAFVKASGQLLSIHDSVGIAMDLDARKAITIPRSMRAAMDQHYLPEFA
jgi:acyl-CoA thioester hydrolase